MNSRSIGASSPEDTTPSHPASSARRARESTSFSITGNARTAKQMADNIDLDVSGVIDDTETLDEAADRLFAEVLAVASGKLAAAEVLRHREFAIHRRNPTI